MKYPTDRTDFLSLHGACGNTTESVQNIASGCYKKSTDDAIAKKPHTLDCAGSMALNVQREVVISVIRWE